MKTPLRLILGALVVMLGCNDKPDDAEHQPAAAPAAANEPARDPDGPVDTRSAKAAPDTWMEFAAADHGFEARFPVAPKKEDISMPGPMGTVPAAVWMAEQGDEFVGVTVMTIPAPMLAEFNVDGALDGGRDGMINNVGGTIVSEKQAKIAGHDARAIVAKVPNPAGELELEARLLWVSPRLYQLMALTPSSSTSTAAQKFFDSFVLTSAPAPEAAP
jgi:hypothetical protein